MSATMDELLQTARTYRMTPAEQEEQRRSFAYGNAAIENAHITRDMIDTQADLMRAEHADD